MDWKEYEEVIYEYFETTYPDASIKYNQNVLGRFSKVNRQIDILVEDYVAGTRIKIIVDAKYYSKKIDVKDVESFISMVEDVEASQGILITSIGYSEAAINRAYYGPTKVELDILNFEDLKKNQGMLGIPYSGKHGGLIPAPFGWILDSSKRKGFLASLYPRGLDFETAVDKKEWMYVKVFSFDEDYKNLQDVISIQEAMTLEHSPDAKIEYFNTVKRKDGAKTKIRKIVIDSYPAYEYTGFIEFEEYCLFVVIFTPLELNIRNIKKLEYVIDRTLPAIIDIENIVKTQISELEQLISKVKDIEELSLLYDKKGHLLIEIEDFKNASNCFDKSIKLHNCYNSWKGRLKLMFKTKATSEEQQNLISEYINLAPTNPTIYQDLIVLFSKQNKLSDLELMFLHHLSGEIDDEACGSILYHLAQMTVQDSDINKPIGYLKQSKEYFKKVFTEDHYVFNNIDLMLLDLNKMA